MNTVGYRPARQLGQNTSDAADRERDPDIDLRPPRACQIEGQKGAEADLHISYEKIGPVEPAAALIADRVIEIAPPPAMLRNNVSRSRGITANCAELKNRIDAPDCGSKTTHVLASRTSAADLRLLRGTRNT